MLVYTFLTLLLGDIGGSVAPKIDAYTSFVSGACLFGMSES